MVRRLYREVAEKLSAAEGKVAESEGAVKAMTQREIADAVFLQGVTTDLETIRQANNSHLDTCSIHDREAVDATAMRYQLQVLRKVVVITLSSCCAT